MPVQYRRASLFLLLLANFALVACSGLNSASARIAGVVTPYKMDIVQGNFVSREQVAALKPGMTRLQVRDILGTPLVTSLFHDQRWDYVFTFKRQGIEPQARKVTVFFKGDLFEQVQADALPSEAEFVASLDSGRRTGKIPVLEMTQENLQQLSVPAPKVQEPGNAVAPVVNYPPLEPSAR